MKPPATYDTVQRSPNACIASMAQDSPAVGHTEGIDRSSTTATVSMEQAVREGDIGALETYIEHGIVHDSSLTQVDITTLWEACWAVWKACDPVDHLGLEAWMATLKAVHPWLPGRPDWAVVDDPEDA